MSSGRNPNPLIGPNGAGKTTLLMLIARLLEPGQGQILIGDRPISELSIRDYAKRVATLRQSPDFNLRLTVGELVARLCADQLLPPGLRRRARPDGLRRADLAQ